jgi:hypothetical protein
MSESYPANIRNTGFSTRVPKSTSINDLLSSYPSMISIYQKYTNTINKEGRRSMNAASGRYRKTGPPTRSRCLCLLRSFSTTLLLCMCYLVLLVSSSWPFSTWVVPVFLLEYYCIITLRICCLLFKFVFWRLICDMQASLPQIPFQNSILFSSAHCFLV